MIGTVIQLDTKLEANCNSKFNTDHGERLHASGDLLEMESTDAWNLLGD